MRYFIVILISIFALVVGGETNDNQIRINPELEAGVSTEALIRYDYIKYDSNKIELNGDDWSELRAKINRIEEGVNFTVLHIGDSHVQADGSTGMTRALMQNEFGNAGRGLIIPFKLAGTNEPRDYFFTTSTSDYTTAKLLKLPWPTRMSATGIAIHPNISHFEITLSCRSRIKSVTLLYDGDLKIKDIKCDGKTTEYEVNSTNDGLNIITPISCDEITIVTECENVDIYGAILHGDKNGVLYHAIGNNGATFSSYNNIGRFDECLEVFSPDLIIVSLGTNEAFGKFDVSVFENQIESMLRKIRNRIPEAKILLTTPAECQKTYYTYRKRGKKKRRRVKSHRINDDVAKVRNVILEYSRKNNIPVYDFYLIAGGEGATNKWLQDKLLGQDRIHRTWSGYELEGKLMYDALRKALLNSEISKIKQEE